MTTLKDLTGTWTIDPSHTEVGFVARHAMVTKVRGSFTDVTGTANFDNGVDGGQVDVTIKAESVDTAALTAMRTCAPKTSLRSRSTRTSPSSPPTSRPSTRTPCK